MKPSVMVFSWSVVVVQAVLMAAVALLLKNASSEAIVAATRIVRPHEARTQLAQVRVALGTVEDAIHDYLRNPTAEEIEEYDVAFRTTLARLSDLRSVGEDALTADELSQVERITHETLSQFDKVVRTLKESGTAAGDRAFSLLEAGGTAEPLQIADGVIDGLLDREGALIVERQRALQTEVSRLNWSLLAAGVVALLLQARIIVLVQRDWRQRGLLQEQLRSEKDRLEATVTERTASLNQTKDELTLVSRHALQVQEQERRSLALELHDQIGQQLAALMLILQHIAASLGPNTEPKLHATLRDGIDMAKNTYNQVHDMAINLRPSMLDRLGLAPTLEWYARQQSQRAHCAIDVSVGSLPEGLPTDLLTPAFRIAQEAVTNALRHGRPSRIEITVRHVGDHLELAVHDDGAGFDPQAVLQRAGSPLSLGILGMRERAALVGGTLEVLSQPGVGTEIKASLPIAALRKSTVVMAAPQ